MNFLRETVVEKNVNFFLYVEDVENVEKLKQQVLDRFVSNDVRPIIGTRCIFDEDSGMLVEVVYVEVSEQKSNIVRDILSEYATPVTFTTEKEEETATEEEEFNPSGDDWIDSIRKELGE